MTVVSTFKADRPAKICLACYAVLFPGRAVGTLTWARECTRCHKPTPSMSSLVKCDPAEVAAAEAKVAPA